MFKTWCRKEFWEGVPNCLFMKGSFEDVVNRLGPVGEGIICLLVMELGHMRSRSRDSPGLETGGLACRSYSVDISSLDLGKSFPLLNLRFLICKVSSVFFCWHQKFLSQCTQTTTNYVKLVEAEQFLAKTAIVLQWLCPPLFPTKAPQKHLSFSLSLMCSKWYSQKP